MNIATMGTTKTMNSKLDNKVLALTTSYAFIKIKVAKVDILFVFFLFFFFFVKSMAATCSLV